MIVVVDSGSTKADWKMINSAGTRTISTMGFNPVFHTENKIYQELQEAFDGGVDANEATQVYYYGAGCWDENLKGIVNNALSRIFFNANIAVEHDLLGAARATCGNEPGIACILGTGSNSCLYDGVDVTDNVTNLGYLLGDEGSGTHLGKSLIRSYFYRELPQHLRKELEKAYPGGKQAMLSQIYGKGTPNVYLASFTKFMSQNIEHPYIQRLLFNSFAEFIDRHVRKYPNHLSLPIHFIGSVAYYFQDIIRVVLEERAMRTGIFIQKPIDNLVTFHT